ncbi:MAG: oligosaccharide flippase family protein, partial [Pseudobdellovibrionaceae bacterium]
MTQASDRRFILTLVSHLLPALLALVAIPILGRHLDDARFGVLTVLWTVMNLFVILDLGAGRIMTQSLATGDADSALGLLRRSERYLLLVFFAAIVIAAIWNHEITDRLFQISDPGLFDEVHVSLILLVLGILPTFAATLARGIFEGLGNFRIANAIQALNYGGLYFFPLVSLLVTNNLAVICSILLLGRALTLIPFYFLGRKKLKEQSR